MRPGDSRAARASSSEIPGCQRWPAWDSDQRAATSLSAALLAGCGSSSSSSSGSSAKTQNAGSSTSADAPAAAFPRSVKHAMGTAEIKAQPKRVVVLDSGELDDVTLLGIKPVGAVSPHLKSEGGFKVSLTMALAYRKASSRG